MTSPTPPAPGLVWGCYPERIGLPPVGGGPDMAFLARKVSDGVERLLARSRRRLLDDYAEHRESYRRLNPRQFSDAVRRLQLGLRKDGMDDKHIAQALALVAVACERTLDVVAYETQVIAADIVLHDRLAEMATGEGKTYAIALAAGAAALAGIPVHVMTANDYLAGRDADRLRPVYLALGLTVGTAIQGQAAAERRAAYGCHIVYGTAKELVFDYLRDGLRRDRNPIHQRIRRLTGQVGQAPMMRGLCMAIVDEADAVLIDEARVPFILSRPMENRQETAYLDRALSIARRLSPGADFRIDGASLSARLTDLGGQRIEALVQGAASVWRNRLHREETVCTALAALHLYQRDSHYVVRDGKVLIIDPTTGRIADGRSWSRGLHQLIEMKEGCRPTEAMETVAQITYQRFFSRYLRLAGLSGTLAESARELATNYGLSVQPVPLRFPCRRKTFPSRLFPDSASLWQAVTERVREIHRSGRPILVGTSSVADSEALSSRLGAGGIAHRVLNARNDRCEAGIISLAGQRGAVTVATNMAGRGTDILLGDTVADLGGLHVICCQINSARRIDRQLKGRCARQGDPGSIETWVAADNPLLKEAFPEGVRRLIAARASLLPSRLVDFLIATVQRLAERRHGIERKRLLEHDRAMDRGLRFSGRME